ncbi:hypothetical protein [Streptomyces virginiae]|uniref:hypothetical protein n=1 Tax=Streptomyces virginiae TaxID=1961 RepID=UPI0035E26EFF
MEGAAAAAKKGGDWLAKGQQADGALIGSGPTAFPNANSTGLGGQALAATGHQEAADKAASWIKARQISAANAGAAAAEIGAIAYNDEALDGAKADDIPEFGRDQWRRSTPQALLALAQVPLAKIGLTDQKPSPDPSDKPSGDPSKSPSGEPSVDPSKSPVRNPERQPVRHCEQQRLPHPGQHSVRRRIHQPGLYDRHGAERLRRRWRERPAGQHRQQRPVPRRYGSRADRGRLRRDPHCQAQARLARVTPKAPR